MHEMGITQSILATAFDAAEEAGCNRITEIRISVGEMTEIVEFALQFAFEALTPGTMAEGATLVVNNVPARSRCNQCGAEYEHDRFQMVCPRCGALHVELLQGRELLIDAIECDEECVSTSAVEPMDAAPDAVRGAPEEPASVPIPGPSAAEE